MRLWTEQPLEVVDLLEGQHSFLCDPQRAFWYGETPGFRSSYDWMVEQMELRVPRPHSARLPVWAWYLKDGTNARPQRDRPRESTEDLRLIELEAPSELVLLSDFEAWSLMLNGLPILEDREYGLPSYELLTEEEIKATWHRVFEVESSSFVQACLWSIEPSQVVAVYSSED